MLQLTDLIAQAKTTDAQLDRKRYVKTEEEDSVWNRPRTGQ